MENESTEYAGFWIRFVAYFIDSLLIGFLQFVLILPLLAFFGYTAINMDDLYELDHMDPEILIPVVLSAITGFGLSIFLLTWLYFALMQSGSRQATVGKMALGLIVTDANGDRISFATASLRYFCKIISSAIFMIGYIMAGFTVKKQALHDIIANTLVIRK